MILNPKGTENTKKDHKKKKIKVTANKKSKTGDKKKESQKKRKQDGKI